MTGNEQLQDDIAYVRNVTERSEAVHVSALYLMWAPILLCGYMLPDMVDDPRWTGWYWLAATPVGFVLSVWLCRRAYDRAGQADRQRGLAAFRHWLAFVAAGLLGNLLVMTGHLSSAGGGSLWLLLLALTYFQAGVHYDRRLLRLGLLLGPRYLITLYMPVYASTTAGVAAFGALVTHAFLGAPVQDAAR